MAAANPLWGAPRIHGELMKLGIEVAERTVSRLIPKRRTPPSQTWRTFLANHVRDLVAIDFFTVPTARLRVLFVLVVLAHHRRRVVHFNVTEHPTAAWTAQQIVEAFPDDTAPSYLLRDRDRVYGHAFRHRVKGMRIREVLTAAHSPWQNPFAERLIGSIRRECLDHVLVLSERHLRRILTRYFAYYHRRAHSPLARQGCTGRKASRAAGARQGRADSAKSVACIIAMSGSRRPDLASRIPSSSPHSAPFCQAVRRSSVSAVFLMDPPIADRSFDVSRGSASSPPSDEVLAKDRSARPRCGETNRSAAACRRT